MAILRGGTPPSCTLPLILLAMLYTCIHVYSFLHTLHLHRTHNCINTHNYTSKHAKQLPINTYHAQVVLYRGRLYVGGGETSIAVDDVTICIYNFTPDTWDTIKGPTRLTALAVYQGHLVLACGILPTGSFHDPTNQLWLTNSDQHTWKQTIPPMPISTWGATAITTDKHLIISGGSSGRSLDIVQVYDGTQWALAHPLSKPCCCIKSTYYNDIYYLIGGQNQGQQVFYISLHSLIQSAYQTNTTHNTPPTVWNTLTDAPYKYSSIAVLQS